MRKIILGLLLLGCYQGYNENIGGSDTTLPYLFIFAGVFAVVGLISDIYDKDNFIFKGIFTGEGIICTIVAIFFFAAFYNSMNEGRMTDNKIVLIVIFILWEWWVNSCYSKEASHKAYVKQKLKDLKFRMDNAVYPETYRMLKNEYDSIMISERARKTGKVIGILGTLAATNSVMDKHLKKNRESFDRYLKKSNESLDRVSDLIHGSREKEDDDNSTFNKNMK